MCRITVICPGCGALNKDLYLNETDGWFDCDNCGKSFKVEDYEELHNITVWLRKEGVLV